VESVPGPVEAGGRVSALDLLGGGLQFTRRVRVAFPEETRESIRGVSPSNLLRSGLELLCRSIVLVEHGIQGRDRRAKEVSLLKHQLAEASKNFKQSLAANIDLSTKIALEGAEREIAQKEAAEMKRLLAMEKAERQRVAAENEMLKKQVKDGERKLSSSAEELAALQAAKDEVEAELD